MYELSFDTIRIPSEPEPEKPIETYRGKKPDYEDALSLLNDKTDLEKLKTFVLEGVYVIISPNIYSVSCLSVDLDRYGLMFK